VEENRQCQRQRQLQRHCNGKSKDRTLGAKYAPKGTRFCGWVWLEEEFEAELDLA